jgi:hypothetical protein
MDRFKEGWIQINRPFDVSILKYPLQKFSIFFRYHYGFKYKEELMYKGEGNKVKLLQSRFRSSLPLQII